MVGIKLQEFPSRLPVVLYLYSLFLSCKANARVYLAKTGHGPHSSLIVLSHVLIVLFYVLFCVDCVVHVLFVCKSLLLPPGVNPITVKYIISYNLAYIREPQTFGDREVHPSGFV